MLIVEKRSASMPSCDNVVTCWSQGLEKKQRRNLMPMLVVFVQCIETDLMWN